MEEWIMRKWICIICVALLGGVGSQAAVVGEWNFDDQTVNDTVTGVAHRGIYRIGNVATNAFFSTDTHSGEGYSLDLTTDTSHMYILGGNDGTGWLEPSNFTYSVWVKADSWTAADNQWNSVFSKQDGAAGGFRLTRTGTTAYTGVDFLGTGAAVARDTVDQVDVADNAWHHLAFTYDGVTSRYYIDGVLRGSAASAYNQAATAHLVVGAWNTAGIRSINGLIDDFVVYDTALSAEEIAALFDPLGAALVGKWTFDDQNMKDTVTTNDHRGIYRSGGVNSEIGVYSTDTPPGYAGYSLDLSTNTSHMYIFNSETYLPSNSFTYSVFVKTTNWTSAAGWDAVLSKQVGDLTTGSGFRMSRVAGLDYTGVDFLGVTTSGSCRDSIDQVNVADSAWHHLAFTYDGTTSNLSYYIDGVLRKSATCGFIPELTKLLVVGAWDTAGTRSITGLIDELQIYDIALTAEQIDAIANPPLPVEPFDVIPAVNLISNGDFSQVTNQTGTAHASRQWNINGTFGDFSAFWGLTADVPGWATYYADPNGLTANIGTVHADDGGGPVLDGTFYLDTLIDDDDFSVTLNSSMDYKNGLIQTDILNGATIQGGATYQLLVDAYQSSPATDQSSATFTVALTTGAGSTNPASAVTGSLLSVAADSLPTAGGTFQTNTISGADLLAAQTGGEVNMIIEHINTKAIAGYPSSPNPTDVTQVSQLRIDELWLTVVVPEGDVNKDGVVNTNDVNLAQLYLDGDGGESATNRQDTLIGLGYTPADALVYLNLTDFDLTGDDYFDDADIDALTDLLFTEDVVINSIVIDGSGNVVVEAGGLLPEKTYYLKRDDSLVGADFSDIADSATTAFDNTLTLTDSNAPAGQAFYRVTD
jgi:hypothetical protein